MKLINEIKDTLQERINKKNRKKLTNLTPTIIASNCTGGFLYHWLGLQFRSPFINLYMTPNDFKNPDLQVGHNRVGSGVFTL